MELSLSSCPDNVSEESDEEGVASHRYFPCLDSKKASSGSSLLMWVQRHWQQSVTGGSLANTMAVGKDQHGEHIDGGSVFAFCQTEFGRVIH